VNGRRTILAAVAAAAALSVWVVPAAAAPPTNTTAPTITGTPRVGETLTAQNGTWANNPTAFQYQWQRCNAAGAGCVNVPGAVARSYLLGTGDAGRTMRVRVTAANADGAANARSAPTGVVTTSTAPQSTARPTVEGEPRVGEELTANEGTWTNNPASFAYQWQRCDIDAITCAPVVGATGKTYGVRTADIGFRLRVTVTARNASGAGAATSIPTEMVVPGTAITNARPTLRMISARFLGARIYVRFRICDDTPRNLVILATDSKPRAGSQTRRFATRVAPNPCGVYTRSWVPARKFRTSGRYTVTIRVRDLAANTSAPASRTFNLR
jgi:hypothetical protein